MNVSAKSSYLLDYFIAIAFTLLFTLPSFAQSSENQQIVFEGSLTDTSGTPIDLSGEALVFYISANGCYLYGETTTLAGDSQGNINHRIGSSSLIPGSPNGFTQNLFFGFVSGTTTFAGNDCSITPSDTRLAQVYYGAESITASIKLGTVPYAHNATMLNGKVAADFIETSNDSVMLFYGGSNGQILSKTVSGLTWVNPSAPAVTSSSITTALGYTPANKSNNLSDLASATVARTNLGLGILATKNSVNLATAEVTGTLSASSLPGFSGDVSTSAGSSTTTLQKIRGVALSATAPVSGQILYYDGSSWGPMTVPAASDGSKWLTGAGGIYATSNTTVGSSTTYSNVGLTAFAPASVSNSIIASLNNTNSDGFGLKVNVDNNNPSQYGLKVSAFGATTFVVRNDGNVGIGLATPAARLQITAGSASLPPLKLTSGTLQSTPSPGAFEYDGNKLYITDESNIRRSIVTGNATNSIDNISNINSPTNLYLNPMGSVIVSSTIGSINPQTGALIVQGGVGITSSVNLGGGLNASGSIVTTGNIGVSKTPAYALDINGVTRIGDLNQNTNYAFSLQRTGSETTMEFLNGTNPNTDSGSYLRFSNSDFQVKNMTPGGSVTFDTNAVERMKITSNGNVGIGTSSPGQKLSVAGTIESTTGGYKFPDGTSQTTSAFGGYERVSAACTLSASCSATCSAGKKIISGGCDAGGSAGNLKSSYPISDNQWRCDWSTSITAGSVWAICTKI